MGIAAAVFRDDFSTAMKDSLSESLYNNTEVDKEAWDSMQREVCIMNLQCNMLIYCWIQMLDTIKSIYCTSHAKNNDTVCDSELDKRIVAYKRTH